MNRRRTKRTAANSRDSLQLALGSWARIRRGWEVVFERARFVKNFERMTLAESKLDECRAEIVRIEALLDFRKMVR
jgi:hypothetical protein